MRPRLCCDRTGRLQLQNIADTSFEAAKPQHRFGRKCRKRGLTVAPVHWYGQNSQGVFRAWPNSATTSAVERTSENRAITLTSVALCSSSLRAALASETMTHL